MRRCPSCGEEVKGRTDKKFCNPYCKSAWHYEQNRDRKDNLFKKIDDQLKLNRRLLKEFNKAGKSMVRKQVLLARGFDPSFFTHYWKNDKGQVYLFCYEYGFLQLKDNNKNKFLLIHWQSYMDEPRE